MDKIKNSDTQVLQDPEYSQLNDFLDDNSHKLKQLSRGDIVEGEVVDVNVNNGVVIVDVGYKSEGIIAGRELKSDTLDWTKLQVGDKVLVYVVKPEDEKGQLILSIRRTQQASAWLALENAKKNNEVVEAVVVESNNGGLIVEIGKGIRGFIPTSQLDATRVYANGVRQVGRDISSKVQKRLNSLIGEKIKTRIIELDREKNRIILSEKMVTQARDIEKRTETLKKVKEGDVLEGTISGITPFGVFVNAQGLEGLVHLSEISWDKVEDIKDDKNYVYDFHVPVSHTFIGNGFVNHNTYLNVLAHYIKCVLYPNNHLCLAMPTKEQSAKVVKEKVEEYWRDYPMLKNELIISKCKFEKDYVKLVFKNGSTLDTLTVGESSRGLRANGISLEEITDERMDRKTINEVLLPILAQPRRIPIYGTDYTNEYSKTQAYVTTASNKQSYCYEKFANLYDEMVQGKPTLVLGTSYEMGTRFGTLDAEDVAEKADDPTYSPMSFDRINPVAFARNSRVKTEQYR